jgi:hypothetical protein
MLEGIGSQGTDKNAGIFATAVVVTNKSQHF